MIFRLGYVAMTLSLTDCSPSSTTTVTAFAKIPNEEARIYRLRRLLRANLKNTYRILLYNQAYNIKVYRFTSKLVPLATHMLTKDWDYTAEFSDELKQIGDYIKENDFRVSAHPDHYTLINSSSQKVLEESLKDLDYHVKIFEAMGLKDYKYKLILHVGGLYKDKEGSLARFKDNFEKLPDRIRKRLIIENDDKSYTAADVLQLCKDINTPMVLDVHHHNCVNNGEKIETLLPDIFRTWDKEYFPPKVHFSSPKSCNKFRSHSNDIEFSEFKAFLDCARLFETDFDVMLEAKNKDKALLKLSKELSEASDIKKISDGEFQINEGR